jgi:predicted dehydrogenase
MVSEDPVRVGIVGAGAIAQVSHLPALARIPGVKVVALCDVDPGKAHRVASRFNVPRSTTSFEELASMDELDAVDICLPNHLHAPAALAALKAGKHVLCERPFTRSSKEAGEVVAAAKKAKRVLMSGFNSRFREDVAVLKRFVAGGEIGSVFYAKTGWLLQSSTWSGAGWRKKKQYAGGGVLLDLGVQMLDTTLWLLDLPKVTAVSASAHPHPDQDRMESTASAMLRLSSGGSVTLEVSWSLLMERDFAYVNLFGDKGAALLNPLRLHKEMHGSLVNVTPNLTSPRNTYKLSYENELRHFVECVRTGDKPLSPGEDAVEMLRLLEALYRSVEEGREVELRRSET